MNPPDAHYEVWLSAPSADEAAGLGQLALGRRLAACAQVSGPITSTYWWEGELVQATEWRCGLKTTAAKVGALCELLEEAHSYEVPEIVALPIAAGSAAYLAWLDSEVAAPSPGRGAAGGR